MSNTLQGTIPHRKMLASSRTLRDEIAINALAALISHPDLNHLTFEEVSNVAYEHADAMLIAREVDSYE